MSYLNKIILNYSKMLRNLHKLFPANSLSVDSVLLILLSAILFVCMGFNVVNNDTSISHCAEAINMFDNSLLEGDLDVISSSLTLSPRFGANTIYFLFLNLGFSFATINYLLYVLTCLIFGFCVVVFVKDKGKENVLFNVIMLTVLLGYSRIGLYAGFGLFDCQAPPLCLATAISFTAVTIVLLRKGASIPFALIALSSFIHIHEGIYGFVAVLIILVWCQRKNPFRLWGFYLAISVLLLLTIPNMLLSSPVMSPSEFYQIYVRWRTPHHLYIFASGYLPHALMLATYIFIYLYSKYKGIIEKQAMFYRLLILLFVLIVFVWYLTYEILESKFFIKMYLPKAVKYISFLFSLLIVQNLSSDLKNRNFYPVIFCISCLFFTPFTYWNMSIWLLCPALLFFMTFIPANSKYYTSIWILLIMLSLYFAVAKGNNDLRFVVFVFGLLMLSVITTNHLREKFVFLVMTIPLLNMSVRIKMLIKEPSQYITNIMEMRAGKELYDISRKIELLTAHDATILCDAFSNVGSWTQYISKRIIYADFKSLPSSENGIKEWERRCKELEVFSNWSASQIYHYMSTHDIQYVLVNRERIDDSYKEWFNIEYTNDKYCFLQIQQHKTH